MQATRYIELKDVTICNYDVAAFGRFTIPRTFQSPEMYALSIYLRGCQQQIVVTYDTVEERDDEYNILKAEI